jgi:DNA-binding HxlR family transcriptional regulator
MAAAFQATISTCAGACPVQRSLEVLDGKWTLLILRELLSGTKRFSEMRRAIAKPGAPQRLGRYSAT